MSLDEYVFNTEAHPLQMPLPAGKARPTSFIPTWRVSELDKQLRKIHDDPLERTNDAIGAGTWVQKQLSKLAFAKQNYQ
jgi:hypothetical protein